ERPFPQQGRQGTSDAPRIRAGEVHAENRFVNAVRPPLIPRHGVAAPLERRPVATDHPRAGQRNRRGAQAGRQRPLAVTMAVSLTRLADSRRARRAKRHLQLLFHDGLDRLLYPSPDPLLNRIGPESLPLAHRRLLGIVLHPVILRHPPPSGRSSSLKLRRMMTRLLLFHHLQDTTLFARFS